MDVSRTGVAVIVDLVRSREYEDRVQAQRAMLGAISSVNQLVPSIQPLAATIGDEFQGLYADAAAALRATLLLRLAVPEPYDCRFGIGVGDYQLVGQSSVGIVQDGTAWWLAREAIEETRRREKRQNRTLRTWLRHEHDPAAEAMADAYLLGRDELVSSMSARSRRLLLGLLEGRTQGYMAQAEGISQSAVSQGLRTSGAHAVLAGAQLIEEAGIR
jgi:hypothetical protein